MITFKNIGHRECTIEYGTWNTQHFVDLEKYIGKDKIFITHEMLDWHNDPVKMMDFLFDTLVFAIYSLNKGDLEIIKNTSEWEVEFSTDTITFRHGLVEILAHKEVENGDDITND